MIYVVRLFNHPLEFTLLGHCFTTLTYSRAHNDNGYGVNFVTFKALMCIKFTNYKLDIKVQNFIVYNYSN